LEYDFSFLGFSKVPYPHIRCVQPEDSGLKLSVKKERFPGRAIRRKEDRAASPQRAFPEPNLFAGIPSISIMPLLSSYDEIVGDRD